MSVCRSAPQHGLLRRDSYSNATGSTLISSISGLKIPGPSEREGLGGGWGGNVSLGPTVCFLMGVVLPSPATCQEGLRIHRYLMTKCF